MSGKIGVGVLGATGMVGQNYIRLLENHPWFEVAYLAASPNSAGKKYKEAVGNRWAMNADIPANIKDLVVEDASNIDKAAGRCSLVFSAVEMEKKEIIAIENGYAAKGFAVVSNNSAHRFTPDVPMLIPEVNPEHLDIIPIQRKNNGWSKGLLAVKSNCSIQSYMAPVYALIKAGYPVRRIFIATLQAVSGAGYPGVASLDIVDNIIPYIGGEEEKSEKEPLKVFGTIHGNQIVPDGTMKISAHCNRVPVIDGHTACVSLEFDGKKPAIDGIKTIWRNFSALPQELKLPFAPERPIIYRDEENRPQPRKDRDADKEMAVTVGRLRPCNIFDIRFVGLHHNTVRGAAGGAILTAELLKAKGFIG
jgi:aspartate-semialdehyde dehydrogenase